MAPPFSQLAPSALRYRFDGSLVSKLHHRVLRGHVTAAPLESEDVSSECVARDPPETGSCDENVENKIQARKGKIRPFSRSI